MEGAYAEAFISETFRHNEDDIVSTDIIGDHGSISSTPPRPCATIWATARPWFRLFSGIYWA